MVFEVKAEFSYSVEDPLYFQGKPYRVIAPGFWNVAQ